MNIQTKEIIWFGRKATIACDGKCEKAWGISSRPKKLYSEEDEADYSFLADDELGDAAIDPGTYEGGCAKPESSKNMNKWCARECERSKIFDKNEEIKLKDFTKRVFNQPSKHEIEKEVL